MALVCEAINTANQCLLWVEQASLLPPLSYAEATAIGGAFWLCLATVWSIKTIRVQLFEKN